jgi:cellulose synthase/poly-beta-1,6-N-acetylglucosamine synthase-like glycosyltransferase
MIFLTAQIIFWLSVIALFYTYIGYPLFVYLYARFRPRQAKKGEFSPSVTVIITAYNEEKDIRAKLENTLALDYPKEKLEILVASDGSTDSTDEIVKEFAPRGVRLFRQEGRLGKTMAQNTAVTLASGEIILFSDATTMYKPNVLQVLLPNFADETIGCAAGKLIYVNPNDSGIGDGAQSYWNYETFLKQNESRACSLIGVSGCLYAVRKSAYVPMYAEACSDFLIATKVYEQGLRTIYEPDAVCTEETNDQTKKEMRMRVRIITQTFTDLWRHRYMMNPFRSGFYAIQLISHKVFRYSVPLFLLTALFSSGVTAYYSFFYAIIFLLQVVFYATAGVSWILEKSGLRIRLLVLPQYFVLTNLASVIAAYQFLRGERYATWQPIRSSSPETSQTKINVRQSTQQQ